MGMLMKLMKDMIILVKEFFLCYNVLVYIFIFYLEE